jgi:hypothetical protein
MRKSLSVLRIVGWVALALLPPRMAQADLVYGTNAAGSQLVVFDTDTLRGSVVGQIGFGGVAGLAADREGVLYGLCTSDPDRLLIINPATGAGRAVGTTGLDGDLGAGLASDPSTGQLYGAAGQIGQKFLFTLSRQTGAATVIAPFPPSVVGLEFDASGHLWAIDGLVDRLVRVDPATGATTTFGAQLPASIGGLTIGVSGTFWAVDSGNSVYSLYSIDPATGIATGRGVLSGIPFGGPMIGLASMLGALPHPDSDGDGFPDDVDACPSSDLNPTIGIDGCETLVSNAALDSGCTMADRIAQCAADASSHGAFVGCVSHLAHAWRQEGWLENQQTGALQRCAGQARNP